MKRYYTLLLTITVIFTSILMLSCGKDDKKDTKSKASVDTKPISIKQFDTPPGADPSVSAEMGGAGFTGEGWTTNNNISRAGNPKATKGGMLVMSMPDFPATLRNVGKDENSYFSRMAATLMYEGLTNLDPVTEEFIPSLATHWKISDDKKEFTFRINPDARWADGKPVTSDDVIATWKLITDQGILSPETNELYKKYEQPTAISKYIVKTRVLEKDPDWRLFLYFGASMAVLPAHYIGGISGKEYLDKYQFEVVPGTGPYIIDKNDIKKGQTISIKRRSDYWGEKLPENTGLNNFDVIRFEVIADQKLEFEKFKKGDIDVLSFTGVTRTANWEDGLNTDETQRGLIQKVEVYNENPAGTRGFAMNMRKPPFDDIRVRKAFAHLLDRKKILEKLFRNSAALLYSYYANSPYENPDNIKIEYNFDEGVKLLAEAGYNQKNSEGYLTKDGKVFEVELPFGNPSLEKFLTVYQEDLKKAGVKLNLKQVDGTTNFKLGNERNFTMLVAAWGGLRYPNPQTSFSTSSAKAENSTNWPGISDPRIDELIEKYNREFDRKERIKIIRQIDKIATDYIGYAFTWYYPAERIAFHDKFGFPPGMLTKTGDYLTLPGLWFIDQERLAKYEEAKSNKSMKLEILPKEDKYWLEVKKQLEANLN
ncbi:MAG: ABC transporter substrate-binding protein [Ignavibacteria bacterium]|nr:ABC transporter substrate-binding protein [Ignavibacteria bacterium]